MHDYAVLYDLKLVFSTLNSTTSYYYYLGDKVNIVWNSWLCNSELHHNVIWTFFVHNSLKFLMQKLWGVLSA